MATTSYWNEETKAAVVKRYLDAKPTPDTSVEIIKEIAEEINQSPNGIRMVLVQADAYVKKEATAKVQTGTKSSSAGSRVSKEDAIGALRDAINAKGFEADDDILSKLTGKAAVYLTKIISG
jgi:hypothetical protein